VVGDELFGTRFGPDTLPSSDSADGQATGIQIASIDTVQVGAVSCPPGPDCPLGGRFLYRDRLGFDLAFVVSAREAGPPLQTSLSLEDDGPVFEPRLADLDGDGIREILLAASGGGLLAFTGTLDEFADGDGDPSTLGILARAVGPDGPPRWLGAPVVGDLDGDGGMEIVLGAPEGVYAFDPSGAELLDGDGDPATFGLFIPAPSVGSEVGVLSHAPLMAPYDGGLAASDPSRDRAALVVGLRPASVVDDVRARRYAWDGAALPTWTGSNGLSHAGARRGVLLEDPGGRLRVVFGGPVGSGHGGILVGAYLEKEEAPALPPPPIEDVISALSYHFRSREALGLAALDSTGALSTEYQPRVRRLDGPWSELVGGPLRRDGEPLVVLAAGDALHLLDRNLSPRVGGPYRPAWSGDSVAGGEPAAPLLVDVDGDGAAEAVWHDRVGRLHAVSGAGASIPGWPIGGPAEPSGSPAVGDVDGDGFLEMVSVGAFEAMVEVDPDTRLPVTRRVGEIRVHDLAPRRAGDYAPWPQGGADAWATGHQRADSRATGVAVGGAALDETSLVIYPNPAHGAAAHLRVVVRRTAMLQASVLSLEGQEVVRLAPRILEGGATADLEFPLRGLANGLYVARVEADGAVALRAFAVAR
jgi:hypothetical protein